MVGLFDQECVPVSVSYILKEQNGGGGGMIN